MTVDEFWNEFLTETGKDKSVKYIESFHFELTEKLANELLELVLSGQKKATSSSLWSFKVNGERIPEVGDYSIVTDWDGNPRCIIETTAVTRLPFKDMTYDICKREGEDDNLESWQRGHKKYFTEEGKVVGYTFTEEMPVIFEDFKVVYRK